MSYFDGIKIGDRVYSLTYGEGVVTDVCPEEGFGIRVSFDSGEYEFFTMDGKFFSKAITQDLYWQKPDVTIIDKGKRLPDLPVVMPRLPTRCPECGSEDMHHGRTAKKGRPITQCLSCKGWFGPRTA